MRNQQKQSSGKNRRPPHNKKAVSRPQANTSSPARSLFNSWITSVPNANHLPPPPNNLVPTPTAIATSAWPNGIIDFLMANATKYAATTCKAKNIEGTIAELQDCLMNGDTPRYLAFRFKKLYTAEHQHDFKTAIIKEAVQQEIREQTAKLNTLKQQLANHHATMTEDLKRHMSESNLLINTDHASQFHAHATATTLLQFRLKANKDKEAKDKKRADFEAKKEAATKEITVTTKHLQTFQNTIRNLQGQISQLKSSGKAKGAQKTVRSETPKSIKKGKNDGRKPGRKGNGNKKSIVTGRN